MATTNRMTIEAANREYAGLLRGIQLEHELGWSSYATVYSATDTDGAECRIKIIRLPQSDTDLTALREDGLDEEEIRTRLKTAMRGIVAQTDRLRQLDISSIMCIEDRRLVEGRAGELILMIRCEPLTIFDEFARSHDITANDVLNLGIAVCSALEAAAKAGVLHGNLTPSNLFIAPDGCVCVADFGEERLLGQALDTVPFTSLLYMSPELQQDGDVSHTSDLYSLGILLYSLFNNRCIPFLAALDADEDALRRAILLRSHETPLPTPANADENIATMLNRACAIEPELRYPSAAAFADDLRDCLVPEAEDYVVLPATETIYEILPLCSGEPKSHIKPFAVGTAAAAASTAYAPPSTTSATGPAYAPPAGQTPPPVATPLRVGSYAGASAYESSSSAAIREAQQGNNDTKKQPAAVQERTPVRSPNLLCTPASSAQPSVAHQAPSYSPAYHNPAVQEEPHPVNQLDPYDSEAEEIGEDTGEGTKRLILVLAAILLLLFLFGGVVWGINQFGNLGRGESGETTGDKSTDITPPISTASPDTTADPLAEVTTDAPVTPDVPDTTVSPTTTAPPDTAPVTTAPVTPMINETTAPPPKTVTMPSLVGVDYSDAAAQLKALGLSAAKTETYSDTVAEGKVISQSLEKGKPVDEGSTVSIVVSLGREKFTVPSLIGVLRSDAEKKLTELSLKTEYIEQYAASPAGTVLAQEPAAGDKLTAGSKVKLTVSLGPQTVTLPDFSGMTLAEAEAWVKKNGLTAVTWKKAATAACAADTIYAQSVAAQTALKPSAPLTLYVSLGTGELTVPSLLHMSEDAAVAVLRGCGYVPAVVYQKSNAIGVISTSPAAGTSLAAGEKVTVTIASATVPSTSLSLPQGDLTVAFAQTVTLQVEGANGRTLTYTSSNTSVASVDNEGRVTANGTGQAKITVSAQGGEAVQCYITVNSGSNLFSSSVSGSSCILTGYTGRGTDVVIPDKINGLPVTAIADNAFAGKTITSVYIPSSVKTIGASAFAGCAHLTTVKLPASLISIGERAFANCSVLSTLQLPAGLLSVGNSAFERCYELTSVYLPASLSTIGDRAFRYCASLILYLPDNSPALDYAVKNDIKYIICN